MGHISQILVQQAKERFTGSNVMRKRIPPSGGLTGHPENIFPTAQKL